VTLNVNDDDDDIICGVYRAYSSVIFMVFVRIFQ